jgi:hypothetical protein
VSASKYDFTHGICYFVMNVEFCMDIRYVRSKCSCVMYISTHHMFSSFYCSFVMSIFYDDLQWLSYMFFRNRYVILYI